MLAAAARQWWVLVIQGALGILFGVLALLLPGITLVTIAYFFAAWALVSGVSLLAEGYRVAEERGRSWPFAVSGVVSIAAGLIAAVVPEITISGLILLLGGWLVVQGAMEILAAWRIRAEVHGEWLLALAGAVRVAIGVIVLAMPIVGALLTVTLLAAWALLAGAAAIGLGLRLRRFRDLGAGSAGRPLSAA